MAIPTHAERYRILTSIPGIGPVTAAALISWMAELGQHRQSPGSRRSLAWRHSPATAGSIPGHGTWPAGRRRPRDLLYMAALTAKSHNPQMIMIYQRLRNQGKHHNVALVAVMRKLIVTANALLRDGRAWSERAPA